MAKNLSEEEVQGILEDRKNGMGIHRVAKKYGVGVPKIRRAENGGELPVAKLPAERNGGLSLEDIQKHFLEVQESFAIVLEELQKTREELQATKLELLAKMEYPPPPSDGGREEDAETQEEKLPEDFESGEDFEEEKKGWDIGKPALFVAGLLFGAWGTAYLQRKPERPKVFYTPPTVEEERPKDLPTKKCKLLEME